MYPIEYSNKFISIIPRHSLAGFRSSQLDGQSAAHSKGPCSKAYIAFAIAG